MNLILFLGLNMTDESLPGAAAYTSTEQKALNTITANNTAMVHVHLSPTRKTFIVFIQ